MDVYQKNLIWLEKSQNDIYHKLIEVSNHVSQEIKEDVNDIKTFDAKNGTKGLIITIKEKEYRLNSVYRPEAEATKWAEQFNYQNLNIIGIMFGLGNGAFAKELLKRLEDDEVLCIYEPSLKIFDFVIRHFDLIELLSSTRVRILIKGINEHLYGNIMQGRLDWDNLKSEIVCYHPQYNELFLEEYKWFLENVQEVNENVIVNKNTMVRFGRRATVNLMYNLRYLSNSNIYTDLYDVIPKDVPAIIVAAGPSLDKNIEVLKEAMGKSIIIATDTAVKYLDAYHILPDFMVTIDPMKWKGHINNYPEYRNIPLICQDEANYEILEVHEGRKIWFSCEDYYNQLYGEFGAYLESYNTGGSVATTAFSMCAGMGFKRIVLIGQDLAYSGETTHAGGGIKPTSYIEDGLQFVDGIDGEPVRTRSDWKYYLRWLEGARKEVPEIDVIDATEGGAKIHGTKIMTLKEVIEQYCTKEVDCQQIMEQLPSTLSEQEWCVVKQYLRKSLEEFPVVLEKIELIIEVCSHVLSLVAKNPYANLESYAKKITKASKVIEKSTLNSLIESYAADISMTRTGDIGQMTEDEQKDIVRVYEYSKEIYEGMREAVKEISPLFKDIVKEIEGR